MIRNLEIKVIQTAGGERYVYGPQTYRTLAEAEAAKAAHEAKYDSHIAEYRRRGAEADAAMLARLAEAGLADTEENRTKLIQQQGRENILQAVGGDKKRAAELSSGKGE